MFLPLASHGLERDPAPPKKNEILSPPKKNAILSPKKNVILSPKKEYDPVPPKKNVILSPQKVILPQKSIVVVRNIQSWMAIVCF